MDGSHPGRAPHHDRPYRPNPLAMAVHLFRTLSLGGSLLGDRRIHPLRKVVFVTMLGVVIAAALGVDVAGEIITQGLNIIPGLGALLGIGELPVDAVVDWLVVAVVAFNLLKLFPSRIVDEHYDRIFHTHKP
jgi:hypothetical protein